MKIKVNEHCNVTVSTPKCAAEVTKLLTDDEPGSRIEVTYAGETKQTNASRFIGAMKHLHQEGGEL